MASRRVRSFGTALRFLFVALFATMISSPSSASTSRDQVPNRSALRASRGGARLDAMIGDEPVAQLGSGVRAVAENAYEDIVLLRRRESFDPGSERPALRWWGERGALACGRTKEAVVDPQKRNEGGVRCIQLAKPCWDRRLHGVILNFAGVYSGEPAQVECPQVSARELVANRDHRRERGMVAVPIAGFVVRRQRDDRVAELL